jgi:hypothetical protein
MLAQFESPAAAVRAHEELFGYWAALKQQRAAQAHATTALPGRPDIHPSHFKRHLPAVSLIDVRRGPEGRRDYRLRLAGTDLYGVYGQEITGKGLGDVFRGEAEAYWRTELDKVVDTKKPAAGVHSLSWRGAEHLSILWLRLPLASDGRRVDMILGYDALIGGAGLRAASGIRAT